VFCFVREDTFNRTNALLLVRKLTNGVAHPRKTYVSTIEPSLRLCCAFMFCKVWVLRCVEHGSKRLFFFAVCLWFCASHRGRYPAMGTLLVYKVCNPAKSHQAKVRKQDQSQKRKDLYPGVKKVQNSSKASIPIPLILKS
jgi:hypothetical protein